MKNRVPILAIGRTAVFGLALTILLILPIGAKIIAQTNTSVSVVASCSQPNETVQTGTHHSVAKTTATPVPPSITSLPGSSIIELAQQVTTAGTPDCDGRVVVNTMRISVEDGSFIWVNSQNGQSTARKIILVR